MAATQYTAGTLLTCANPDCQCELQINTPCPHGDDYRCGCGHPLEAKGSTGSDADASMDSADRANGESPS